MIERYILNKEDQYAHITPTNGVEKTDLKENATVFTSKEAKDMLRRAHKKLNGFMMVRLDPPFPLVHGEEPKETVKQVAARKVFSPEIRNDVYERTEGKCALCGKFVRFDQFTVDHIVPLAKGGTNDLENLQCTCKHCNAMKQDLSQTEFEDKMLDIRAYQLKKKGNKELRKKLKKICS